MVLTVNLILLLNWNWPTRTEFGNKLDETRYRQSPMMKGCEGDKKVRDDQNKVF